MVEIVDESYEFTILLGYEGVDWLGGVEEAGPRRLGDGFRQSGVAVAAVELVVALPEGEPLGVVFLRHWADDGLYRRLAPFLIMKSQFLFNIEVL